MAAVNLPMIAGPSGLGGGGGGPAGGGAAAGPAVGQGPAGAGPGPGAGGPRDGREGRSLSARAGEESTSQQSCLTKIQPIVLSQKWRVQNFASVMKLSKPGQCLRSQAFKHQKFPQACWQLCLYPGGKREENQGYVSLFLKMSAIHPAGEVYQKAEYLFYFVDDEDVPRFSNVNIGEFHAKPPKGGHSWGLRNIPRNKILNSLQSDGSLVILCEVELLPDIKFIRAQEEAGGPAKCGPPATEVPKAFQANLERMFGDQAFTDYVVWAGDETGGGREFRVHRAVLAAQSDVFRAMLEHGEMEESKSGRLVVEDFGAAALESFLRFLYTGRLATGELEETAEEVLGLAEKYGVGDLKALAEDHLVARLSVDNVCQLIVLADMHSASQLLRAAHALIRLRRREILSSPHWEELKARDSRLTTAILERIMDHDPHHLSPPSKKPRL